MALEIKGQLNQAAFQLTQQQVDQAVHIANNANYAGKDNPAFVAAVLVALATNLNAVSIADAAPKPQAPAARKR